MCISDSHEHFELFVAANVLTGLGGGVCGEAIGCRFDGLIVRLVESDSESDGACGEAVGCRLDGLMVCLVDSDSESDGACGEALSCRLDGLVVRLADSPIQVRGR